MFFLICIFAFLCNISGVHLRAIAPDAANGNEGGVGEIVKAEMDELKVMMDNLEALNLTILANLPAKENGGFRSKRQAEFDWEALRWEHSEEGVEFANLMKPINPAYKVEVKERMGAEVGQNRVKRHGGMTWEEREKMALKKLLEHKELLGKCTAYWEPIQKFAKEATQAEKDGFFSFFWFVAKTVFLSNKFNEMIESMGEATKVCESAVDFLEEAAKIGEFGDKVAPTIKKYREEIERTKAIIKGIKKF